MSPIEVLKDRVQRQFPGLKTDEVTHVGEWLLFNILFEDGAILCVSWEPDSGVFSMSFEDEGLGGIPNLDLAWTLLRDLIEHQ